MGWFVRDWIARTEPNVDSIAAVVVFGVCLDFLTTSVIFLDPALFEANEFLTAMGAVHVALPLAINLGYGLVLAGAYLFVGGWVGRVGASMAIPSTFLGVNNVAYAVLGGPTMLDVLFGDALGAVLSYGIPAFGFATGTLWHLDREGSMPWRHVAAVAGFSTVELLTVTVLI